MSPSWCLDKHIVATGVGLELGLGDFWLSVAKAAGEFSGAAFELTEDAFDGVRIPVGFVSESESVAAECRLQPWCGIDKKLGISDEMIFAQLREKRLSDGDSCREIQSHVQQLIRCRITGGIQPVLLVVAWNHCLIECDVIRIHTAGGL